MPLNSTILGRAVLRVQELLIDADDALTFTQQMDVETQVLYLHEIFATAPMDSRQTNVAHSHVHVLSKLAIPWVLDEIVASDDV